MKKLAFLSILALCVGFTSCDNYEEPNPPAQSNPAEPVFEIAGFSSAAVVAEGELVELDSVAAVEVAKFTLGETFPAGYELEVITTMGIDEAFSRSTEVATTVTDGVATIAPADYQAALVSIAGRNPAEKTMWLKFDAYAVKDATKVRIGNPETVYGPYSMLVKPMDTGLVIEEAYYLVGTACDWEPKQAIKLNHSDVDVWDDPVFYTVVDIDVDEWWWKIIPQSTYESADGWGGAQFGVVENGDTSLSGMITDENPGAGCLKVTGPYMLKINMMDYTYEFTLAIESLWTPGNSNSWSPADAQRLTTSDYINYNGVVHIDGEFKLTIQPDWNGAVDYGGEGGTLVQGGNITDGYANGLYWMEANLTEMTYKVSPINTIGVVGSFSESGWSDDIDLTPSTDFLVWTGSVTLAAGDEFKFRANDAWDIDFGGALDNIVYKGGNIKTETAGTFNVTLDFSKVPYTCTLK